MSYNPKQGIEYFEPGSIMCVYCGHKPEDAYDPSPEDMEFMHNEWLCDECIEYHGKYDSKVLRTLFSVIAIVVALTELTACGVQNKYRDAASPFEPYVAKFETLGKQYKGASFTVDNIRIDEADLASSMNGLCAPGKLGETPHISISHTLIADWGISSSQVEAVVMHELGHCILGRAHIDDRNSLMQVQTPYGNYAGHAQEYQVELFK